MGIIGSIKEKLGVGGSGGSDPDASIANEYREIQPEEVRTEGLISHDEGRLSSDSREKYYAEKAISKRMAKRKDPENIITVEKPSYLSRAYSGYKESVSKYNEGQLEKQKEGKFARVERENLEELERETRGMTKHERAIYKEVKEKVGKRKAREKAHKDYPSSTEGERKQKQEAKEADERKVRQAYRESRAKAAGTASVKGIKSGKSSKSPLKIQQQKSGFIPTGMRPVGFESPSPGSGTPGFEGFSGGSPGFRPQMNLRPVGFEMPQAPPTPAPQPERRISRREQHRQQVNVETQRWKQEQQQQFQQNVYYPQPMPMPSHNGTRNGRQIYLRNPFESHQMTYHKPQDALPENAPHVDINAIRSAELLGMGSMGRVNGKGKGKKSKLNVAPWEL